MWLECKTSTKMATTTATTASTTKHRLIKFSMTLLQIVSDLYLSLSYFFTPTTNSLASSLWPQFVSFGEEDENL